MSGPKRVAKDAPTSVESAIEPWEATSLFFLAVDPPVAEEVKLQVLETLRPEARMVGEVIVGHGVVQATGEVADLAEHIRGVARRQRRG